MNSQTELNTKEKFVIFMIFVVITTVLFLLILDGTTQPDVNSEWNKFKKEMTTITPIIKKP